MIAVVSLLFSCCRGRRQKRKDEGRNLDEESQLIPAASEDERIPPSPDGRNEEREKKDGKLIAAVRASSGNMINAFSATPFNLLSQPNPHLPQRYGYNEPVRSSSSGGSHSSSRPLRSTSSVHFERNLLAQGYGATSRGYNPTSRPAPLNPEPSGVQVQINGSRGTTVSTERSASPRKTSATSEASAIPGPPHLHLTNSSTSFPAPPSPSPRPPITTRSTSSNSMLSHSNSGSRSTPRTPRLGVRLVRPLPYGPSTSTRGRGRPQVKETRAAHTSSGTNSPTGTSSPTLAITSHPPPPSPHSSEHSLSPTFSTPFVINIVSSPTFEIRDVGSVVVGWDSD